MNPTRKRTLIAAATLVQLGLLAALPAWRLEAAGRTGWAGLAFLPALDLDLSELELGDFDVLLEIPGVVLLIVPESPAARAGIEPGDVIMTIGGVPVTETERLRALAAESRAGDVVTYDLGERRVDVALASPFESPGAVADVAGATLLGIAFLAIGAGVAWRRPESAGAIVLYLLGAAAAALFAAEAAGRLDVPDLSGLRPLGSGPFPALVYGARLLLLVVATSLLLHFTLVFPRPAARGRRFFIVLHALPLLPFAAVPAAWGVARLAGLAATATFLVVGLAGAAMLFACLTVLLVYSVWMCRALYRSYRQGDARERQQVLWPLAGILAALGGMLLLALGVAAILVIDRETGTAAARWLALPNKLLTLVIPISFACGVLGKKLPGRR